MQFTGTTPIWLITSVDALIFCSASSGEFGLDILDKIPTQFYCNCSKERMSRALISIGRKELSSLIEEGRTIEVNCHFCGSHYNFDVEELKDLLHKAVR